MQPSRQGASHIKLKKKNNNKMTDSQLIVELSEQGSAEVLQALAIAQAEGLVKSQEDLRSLIQAGMESVLEEYLVVKANESKIILDTNGI
jgi:hypothetical protein